MQKKVLVLKFELCCNG